jgi:hypothetical protein
VRALALAAGINKGGYFFRYFSSYLVIVLTTFIKTPEGVVIWFQKLYGLQNKNIKNSGEKIE